MRNISVKNKITILLTILMGVLSGVLLAVTLTVSRSVVEKTAIEQLTEAVKKNLEYVEVQERTPLIDEEFVYYRNGVYTLIYSQSGSLLAGQLPIGFVSGEGFENGQVREVDAGKSRYYLLDMWLPAGWENGVWLRGLVEVPDSTEISRNLLIIAAVTLPFFLLLASVGSYRIIKKAFEPLDRITGTAEAINEAKDLSGRIGLPPGNDEFSRLAADFDHMFERLEISFEAEKQFTADASHELRTPVSVIKGACEYAEKYDETAEEHRETIAMIHRQADKMTGLITQLLTMMRMEQGTEKMVFETMEAGELVSEICREGNWDPSRIEIKAESPVYISGDRGLIANLMTNLIDNAFKYGKADGVIEVSVRSCGDEALLAVKDEGPGIPAEHRDKIWKRFYQADPSRSSAEGAGLGLAIVRQIAQLHGGRMTLESEEGKGSLFTLHVPLINNKKSF